MQLTPIASRECSIAIWHSTMVIRLVADGIGEKPIKIAARVISHGRYGRRAPSRVAAAADLAEMLCGRHLIALEVYKQKPSAALAEWHALAA